METEAHPRARGDGEPRRAGPLDGVRVLDFSRVLSGPYCSMWLADAGADVVKVERPGDGDDTRRWGPPFVAGEAVYFLTVNRNKRSIVLDLGCDEGRQLARRLAERADVVLDNFRPGTMERWGLDHETLAATNPRVVTCSITGWGRDGPHAGVPGYDALVMAQTGLMDLTGEADGPPVRPGVAMLDMATGIAAYGAIASALLARERTGAGQRIDLSLLQVQLAMLVNAATNYLMDGTVAARMGAEHPSLAPYNTFEAKDGYVMVGALHDGFWRRLCSGLDLPELAEDERFASNRQRVAARAEVNAVIAQRVATLTVAEVVERLRAADVPVAPVNDIAGALADPQVEWLGLVGHVDHPTVGSVPQLAPPVEYSATPATIRTPPPLLGEHTDEVLGAELGLSPDELTDLRRRGVIA